MDWDIHQSVVGVLTSSAHEVGRYVGLTKSVQTGLSSLGSSLTNSALVSKAVGDFSTSVLVTKLTSIEGHSGTAVTATSDAVAFYAAGQTDMAANAQKYASSAAYPDDAPGAAKGAPLPSPGRGK